MVGQVMIQGGLGLRQGDGARLFAVATLDGKDVGTTAVGRRSFSERVSIKKYLKYLSL